MAVFKVISVPQKYADEDAYADLIHYCIRPMKTPGNFIDGFGVLPQLAAEQMQIVSHAYRQDHGSSALKRMRFGTLGMPISLHSRYAGFTPNAIRSSTASMRMPKTFIFILL